MRKVALIKLAKAWFDVPYRAEFWISQSWLGPIQIAGSVLVTIDPNAMPNLEQAPGFGLQRTPSHESRQGVARPRFVYRICLNLGIDI